MTSQLLFSLKTFNTLGTQLYLSSYYQKNPNVPSTLLSTKESSRFGLKEIPTKVCIKRNPHLLKCDITTSFSQKT